MIDLKEKKYLVAGLSMPDGIAAGIGRRLEQCGASVLYTVMNSDLKAEAAKANPGVEKDRIFVSNFKFEESISAMAEELTDRGIRLDGAVNATGYADPGEMEEPFRESSWEAMEEAHAINVIGTRFFFTEILDLLNDGASLLVLSYHPGAAFAIPGYHLMGIQKAALESLMRYLALDFGQIGRGLRVNAISPGILPTRSARAVSGFQIGMEYEAKISPQTRNVSMDEVTAEAAWLLSPFSSGTNGQVRIIDTGFLAAAMNPRILKDV